MGRSLKPLTRRFQQIRSLTYEFHKVQDNQYKIRVSETEQFECTKPEFNLQFSTLAPNAKTGTLNEFMPGILYNFNGYRQIVLHVDDENHEKLLEFMKHKGHTAVENKDLEKHFLGVFRFLGI